MIANGQPINFRLHIPELDGVRGLALIMVLIWHYGNCQGAAGLARPFAYLMQATGLFWSGVDLFFVLSGLLIGGILIDHAGKPQMLRTFYIRRAARILPLYTLLLLAFFTCRFFLDNSSFAWLFSNAIPDLSFATFTQNIFMGLNGTYGGNFLGITWSLAVEEQFYLALPLVFTLGGGKRFSLIILVFALLAPFLRLVMPGFESLVNMPFRMDALLIGVGLALALRQGDVVAYARRNESFWWATFFALLAGMGSMTLHGIGHSSFEPTVIALFYATFILLVLLNRGARITAGLRSTCLVRAGMYSYGMYMYHQMVAGLIHGYFRDAAPAMDTLYGAALTLISLLSTTLLAVISYHTVEKYFLRLGKSFRYDSLAADATAVGALLWVAGRG
jgi:peptidoglycan/LPS O-acetylase OafA/YrhL